MSPAGAYPHKAADPRERFEHKVAVNEHGCWLWLGYIGRQGYGRFNPGPGQGMVTAHRVAWSLYRGPIPQGMCVLHRCDVRACVNPDHLFLGTFADNSADMVAKGRSQVGARNSQARLSDATIEAIRTAPGRGVDVARRFGVSQTYVSNLRHGQRRLAL